MNALSAASEGGPVMGARSYTHNPSSLLWLCGWLALLAFAAALETLCFVFLQCAVVGLLSSADSRGQPAGH